MTTNEEYEAARREHARREAKDRRDRFAMAALTGLLADHTIDGAIEQITELAALAADSLIAELDKEK